MSENHTEEELDSIVQSFTDIAEYAKACADDLLYMEMKVHALSEDFKELVDTMRRRSEEH